MTMIAERSALGRIPDINRNAKTAAITQRRARAACPNRGRVSSRAVALLITRSFLLCLVTVGGAQLFAPMLHAAPLQEGNTSTRWEEYTPARSSKLDPQSQADEQQAKTQGTPAPDATVPISAVLGSSPSYQGWTIASVDFQGVSLTPEATANLHELAVKPGEPFSRAKLAERIEAVL